MNQSQILVFYESSLVCSFQLLWEPTPHERVCEELELPITMGWSFYCPECHEVWGRIVYSDYPSEPKKRYCFKHRNIARERYYRPDWSGGSLSMPTEPINDCFPAEFWHHELRLLAEAEEYWL